MRFFRIASKSVKTYGAEIHSARRLGTAVLSCCTAHRKRTVEAVIRRRWRRTTPSSCPTCAVMATQKAPDGENHANYSKRAMASITWKAEELPSTSRLVGHDRGGRVGHPHGPRSPRQDHAAGGARHVPRIPLHDVDIRFTIRTSTVKNVRAAPAGDDLKPVRGRRRPARPTRALAYLR